MSPLAQMVAVSAGVAGVAYWIMKTRERECLECTVSVESSWADMKDAVGLKYICKQCALKALQLYPVYVAKLLEGMANPANGEEERAIIALQMQELRARTNELAVRAGLKERV